MSLVLAVLIAWPLTCLADEPVRPLGYGPLPRGAWACLGSPRFVGDKPFRSVAFSPDGKLLAAGADEYGPTDTGVHVWDLATGQEIATLRGHQREVVAVVFTPDGKRLVSAAWDNTIRVWDVAAGKEERQFVGHERVITGLELTPDGKQVISSSQDGTLRVWDFATGKELRRELCGAESISLGPDGKTLASASSGRVSLCDVQTGEQVLDLGPPARPSRQEVRCSPDGKTLAVVSGGEVALWDIGQGRERLRLEGLKRGVDTVAFTHDGKVLATGGGTYELLGSNSKRHLSELRLWDAETGKELGSCEGHTWAPAALAFSPDDKVLASASRDFSVRLWDWKIGKELPTFAGHSQAVTSLAWSPGGRSLYSGSDDGTVRVWDGKACKELAVLAGHTNGVRALAITPDGKALATGGPDGTVRVWDVAARREVRTLARGHGDVSCLAFSPDGQVLASADRGRPVAGGTVRLWDWQAGKELRRLAGQEGATALAFAADGRTLAVGYPPQISVWEVETGNLLKWFDANAPLVEGLGFLRDGRVVPVGYGQRQPVPELGLWDVGEGARLLQFDPGRGNHLTMALSPDGRLVAGAFETTVHVWEVSTRREVARFEGHRGHVGSLAFGPDGRTLASGGADGAILFWDLTGRRRAGPQKPPDPDALWKELAEGDGRRAVWELAAAPDEAVSLLRGRLAAVPKVEEARVRRLVADLDADDFATREKATKELASLGEAAAPALRQALKDKPNAEVRKRATALLEKIETVREEERKGRAHPAVRMLRAVEVLERAGTPEAAKVLGELADGDPTARLTTEAQAALQRLEPLGKGE
jgi:WD40 repeat protein